MKNLLILTSVIISFLVCTTIANAGVISSEQVITEQQQAYDKQELLAMISSGEVEEKLVALGVTPADAKIRIANMTNQELVLLNHEINDMPAAAGIGGTIVTVLVVIAVLDLLGVTDVYPFIRPIN